MHLSLLIDADCLEAVPPTMASQSKLVLPHNDNDSYVREGIGFE